METTTMSQSLVASPAVRPLDWGRITMVPLSIVCGALSVARLFATITGGSAGEALAVVAALTGVLTGGFYALIAWAYLRRGPARSTTASWGARTAAPVATFLPFGLPFLAGGGTSTTVLLIGDALLVAGLLWSVWSVRCLDRNLSMIAQARDVAETGPYAWVRHPLYLGELVAMLGLALTLGGVLPVVAWVALAGLQAYRAVHEEVLLADTLPAYRGYQQRTARIVPGIF